MFVLLIHYWLQIVTIFAMYHILKQSENTLQQSVISLHENHPIPLKIISLLRIYGISNIICAYICVHILYISIDRYNDITGSIIASCLISLFTFLLISAMKNISVGYRFFRPCDIENGALSLLTLVSVIIRYVFVAPIWTCFLCDVPLGHIPESIPSLAKFYLMAKVVGFWILCSDLSNACKTFFASVLLRVEGENECECCKETTNSAMMTQCGHVLCMKCIDRGRKVSAACPICHSQIPRKWTSPFKYGTITDTILVCII